MIHLTTYDVFLEKKSKRIQIKLLHQMLRIEHDVKGQTWHAMSKTQNEGNFIPPTFVQQILGWPKSSFWFSCKVLQKP